jgi:hypothetical protein
MYKAIRAYGHNVYIVASTKDNSGTGETVSLTTSANLTTDTEFSERVFVGNDSNHHLSIFFQLLVFQLDWEILLVLYSAPTFSQTISLDLIS